MGKFGALAALTATTLLAAGAAPAAAGIWTEVPSGTTSTITAIEYQSETRFWFTTAGGEIWKRRADLTGFQRVGSSGGLALRDIEFQPGGEIGLAVGAGGTVLRSTDGGANWTAVTGLTASNVGDGSGNKCTIATPFGDANFVHFAGSGRAWIGGPDRQLIASQPIAPANVGARGTWYDANRKPVPVPGDNCWVTEGQGFADMFVTSNPDVFYLAIPFWESALLSTNNLTSTPASTGTGLANGFTVAGSLVGDVGSPSRQWSVTPAPYGNSTAVYTEDGWSTSHWMRLLNESSHPWPGTGPHDVAYSGGTVLAAGNGGFIIHSTNGRDFFFNGADGALATTDWRAVALASGTQAAVGGVGGKLVVSSAASTTPDLLRPTGFVNGPGAATAGQPVAFTLVASDEGGSGLNAAATAWSVTGLPGQSGPGATFTFPAAGSYTVTASFSDNAGNVATATRSVFVRAAGTTPPPRRGSGRRGGADTPPNATRPATERTGGATVTTWRQIALSKGRFVPVRISARSPRRFVIEIRRAARPRTRIALSRTSLRRGKKLVKVPLRASTRTGKYLIVVRVYKGRRAIGKRVRTAFVIVR